MEGPLRSYFRPDSAGSDLLIRKPVMGSCDPTIAPCFVTWIPIVSLISCDARPSGDCRWSQCIGKGVALETGRVSQISSIKVPLLLQSA